MSDVVKRPVGRPRKAAGAERELKHEPKQSLKMRAAPNWVSLDPNDTDTPDKLHIPPHLCPPGMALQWVTDSVHGQPFSQHRAGFEKKGWTPVHQSDFDGQLDGMFMPKGADGEIRMTGMALMARPKELNDKAKRAERRAALEQVSIKEQALRGGDLPVSLDSQHPSAINSNRINKSIERIAIPED
jgi:hypothetical protein